MIHSKKKRKVKKKKTNYLSSSQFKIFSMSVTSNTLIGKSRGKIGNVVFSTWKGINVMKEKPISVANPRSDKQKMQRSALSQIVVIFRLIAAVADLGFKKLAVKKSAWNAFASRNLKNAFDFSAPPTAEFDAPALLISNGSIFATPITGTDLSKGAGSFVAQFDAGLAGPGQSISDSVLLVAYNSSRSLWTGLVTPQIRNDGQGEMPIPAAWQIGDNVVLYLGFYSNVTGDASPSVASSGPLVA